MPQPVLLLQQLHGAGEARAAPADHKLPGGGEVDDGAAGAAGIQRAAVEHQRAGGPQLLWGVGGGGGGRCEGGKVDPSASGSATQREHAGHYFCWATAATGCMPKGKAG